MKQFPKAKKGFKPFGKCPKMAGKKGCPKARAFRPEMKQFPKAKKGFKPFGKNCPKAKMPVQSPIEFIPAK
jgi:hypothetical protein